MIKSLKDVLVVADMDNTLLTDKDGIPQCNIDTIKLFCKLGGRFTIATGRTIESAGRYLDKLCINAPAILYGGGVIYDYAAKKRLKNAVLPKETALRAVLDVMQLFPNIGIEIMGDNGRIYIVQSRATTHKHAYYEKLKYTLSGIDDIKPQWNKVLFITDIKTQKSLAEYLAGGTYPGLHFIATDAIYYEIMPQGVSKGSALTELSVMLNIPRENIAAIGDYYNDTDLLMAAGYAVAMGNAPDEIKEIANEVTDTCQNGGAGQFIYKIIDRYTK